MMCVCGVSEVCGGEPPFIIIVNHKNRGIHHVVAGIWGAPETAAIHVRFFIIIIIVVVVAGMNVLLVTVFQHYSTGMLLLIAMHTSMYMYM